MNKPKKLSTKEKLEIYENFFFRLHFHRFVSMNEKKVLEMLVISDNFVNAHGTHERTDKDVENNINAAIERMRTLP